MNSSQNLSQHLIEIGYDILGIDDSKVVHVVRYSSDLHYELWDKFISESGNANLFQTRRFLAYHPEGRFNEHGLLFYQNDELIALAAGEDSLGQWSSHKYTSHAGIAIRPGTSAEDCLHIVFALTKYIKSIGLRQIKMRFCPGCIQEEDCSQLFWALNILGFESDSKELTWCLSPRFSSEEELFASYHNSTRRAIKKAFSEDLVFIGSTDYQQYWELLTENLNAKHSTKPTHTFDEITRLLSLCAGEVSLWIVQDRNKKMLAGSLVFDVSKTASHTFYFAQDYSTQSIRPMPLLMHGLNKEYTLNQKRRLNLGVITAAGATELNLSLSRFKMNFGALPSLRTTYTWESK